MAYSIQILRIKTPGAEIGGNEMDGNSIKTYPEMNMKIVELLWAMEDNFLCHYAAQRIKELEKVSSAALQVVSLMPGTQEYKWAERKLSEALKEANHA